MHRIQGEDAGPESRYLADQGPLGKICSDPEDGRQRWETIGPNRKEAETVLHQRLYEVRSGKYPIIARRTRMTFAAFVEEWEAKHLVRVWASTAKRYRELLKHQLLPAFGDRLLSAITLAAVEAFVAEAAQSGRLAPKTVNHALALLKQLLASATDWGYLAASPVTKVRKLLLPRRRLPLWTPAEIRRFLLRAPEEWRPVWLVGIFTGLRPGEIQAMAWRDQNWPDFTSNRIHVTTSYEARSKVLRVRRALGSPCPTSLSGVTSWPSRRVGTERPGWPRYSTTA